jgi:phosphomevalonate kinase
MANNVQSGSARKTPVYPSEVEKLKTREASAPGKVLIAGGYLVLDQEHVGLVLALSARIHVRIVVQPGDDGMITVTSPQFLNATWKYKCYDKDGDLYVENL